MVGDDTTQDLTLKNLSNTGTQCDVPSVPLSKNKHITLLGDVRNLGLTSVTFTASIDESWTDGGTVRFPKYDLSAENVTIDGNSEVYVYGNGQPTSNSITISGDAKVHLVGVNISTSGSGINITGGSPTLIIEGDNTVASSTTTAVNVSGGATVTIEGKTGTTDKLTATGGIGSGTAGAGIGTSDGGNIVIQRVTVEAEGGTSTDASGIHLIGAAAIGSSMDGKCGNITITDAVIENTQGGRRSPAIGIGYRNNETTGTIGDITISNSTIRATGGAGASVIGFPYAYQAGVNYTFYAGKIQIQTSALNDFLYNLTLGEGVGSGTIISAYKIGKWQYGTNRVPSFRNNSDTSDWEGVYINDSETPYTDGISDATL